MKQIFSLLKFTVRQLIRNRIYYVLIAFSLVIIIVSMLLSVLGGEKPLRIMMDFGLVSIEFFSMLLVIFSGVNLILEEIESRSIYLVLIRPFPKWYYIAGKYAGLVAAVFAGMVVMYVIHAAMLFYKGWTFETVYVVAAVSSMMKIAIIAALAMFFSLFSTSAPSSLVFTVFLWIAGHFGPEIKYLSDKMTSVPAKILLKVIYYLIPNLQYFNWRDFINANVPVLDWLPAAFLYGACYCAFFIVLSILLFRNKEV
jgi:ABC-type transport system involved in multi-copper enzyme maturation permease subunit